MMGTASIPQIDEAGLISELNIWSDVQMDSKG